MSKKEKIALGILAVVAAVNVFFTWQIFYHNHTVLVASTGGLYEEGVVGQPAYINPLLAHSDADLSLTKLVYSGLYKYDGNGQLVPDLADGMPAVSDDQKQYTVNLKHNVLWHNDKPFTADDVVFTVATLQDPNYKSPLRTEWLSTSVEKISDYQVRFTTKDISGPFIQNLTLPIVPKNVWQNVDSSLFLSSVFNLQAVGTGPYAIKEIRKQQSGKVDQISLDSFSNYYGGKPNIDTIVIKFFDSDDQLLNAFQSKDVQGFGFSPSGSSLFVTPNQNTQVLTVLLPQYQVLFFNLKNKILADKNVRQSLASDIDRQSIIDQIFKGSAQLPTSPFTGQPNNPVDFDPAAAQKMLDSAGWKVDPRTNLRSKNGKTLTLSIVTNDSVQNSKAAEQVADAWRQLNIQVILNILPTKEMTDTVMRTRNFDVLIFLQKFGADPDPFAFFHSSQVKDPGVNLTGFADPAADKLMTEAHSTTDQQVRQQKYQQFDVLINQELPVVLLSQSEYFYAVTNEVQNIQIKKLYDDSNRFYNVTNWFIQQQRVWK